MVPLHSEKIFKIPGRGANQAVGSSHFYCHLLRVLNADVCWTEAVVSIRHLSGTLELF